MENKTKVIEIRGLTKRLKNKTVLNDVTLDIFAGDICGISGHNGSGKSMLLKAISGFLQPTSGSIKVFGEDVGVHGKLAKDTGVLIEAPGLLLGYSAFDNLYMLARLDGSKDKATIEEILTTLELDPKDKRPVSKYSLGMKQKVGIAQAVFEKPKLILLDEPTSNIDANSVTVICDMLKRLNSEYGATILIASHQAEDMFGMCNRMLCVESGNVTEAEIANG